MSAPGQTKSKRKMKTTDFESWLEGAGIVDHNEVYSLYEAVRATSEWGAFKCSQENTSKGNRFFVKYDDWSDETLILASDKAREHFLRHIEKKYVKECGMSIETWYLANRVMGKD